MPSAGPAGGTGYVPMSPVRLLDTRPGFVTVDGASAGGGPVAAHSTTNLVVTGRGGVPATGVGAVVLNVTAVGQTANSYLTIWPAGSPQPLASNLNPNPGIIEPNLVIAKVGAGGAVSIYNNAGTVNLIADIQGWFPSPLGASYNPLLPARVLDSRSSQPTIDGVAAGAGALGAGATMTVPVVGRAGVPATGVSAVVLNITATDQTNPTFLTVFPTGMPRPNSSDLNPNPGVTAPSLVIAKVGADGTVSIFNNVGTVNVIADVQGWFPIGPTYTSLDPARVLETRPAFTTIDGQAQGGGPLGAGATRSFSVLGRAGVPATGVSAVVLNVTAANQTNDTFLTVYPSGTPRPNASNLNPFPGLVAPNLVIAKVGADGMVTVYNNIGTVDVIADVHGWFATEEGTGGPATDITVGDDSAAVAEDATATAINVLANDTDALGGAVTIADASQPANGLVALTGGTAGASTGLTYKPNANYCNTPPGTTLDTFTYTVNDGSSATVTVTVNCVDDGPSAVADAATVTEDDPPTAIPVLANDTDIDAGPKTITAVTQPADGTVVITGGGTGLTYEPDADTCGPDTFTYTVNGGSVGTVTVTVTCVDDLPTAVDDSATVAEDATPTAIDVRANDTDDALGPFFISSATQPGDGTVVLTGPIGAATGLTYQPDANFCNTPPPADTFTYTLNGGSVATVSVTVTCVDDGPVATDDGATFTEDDPATAIDVLANDTDIDGGPKTVASVTQPANGTVVITGGGTGLTYQPDADYCNTPPGTTPDTFTYTVNGGDTASVSIVVNCVDDLPVAVDDSATVAEDSAASAIDVLANDTDVDTGTTTIGSTTQPANGTVVITGGGTGLTYAPNANYCNAPPGTTPDTFTYTINGGDVATVTVTVTCLDDAPVAVDDAATVGEDSGASAVDVLANDTDIDGGPKSVASVTQPANGTVVITGGGAGLTYTPNANYCNAPPGTTPDTFTYTLNGGAVATASMAVTCVDDPPVAVDDTASSSQNSVAVPVPVLANDTDIDGGPKSISSVTQPANGTVIITGGGTGLTYQPNANYCDPTGLAPDTFTYTLTPGTSTATVKINVACDAPPVAVADAATVAEDAGATAVDVLANDTDTDGGPKTVESVTQPANGTVVITGGGTGLTYAPDADYCNSPPGTTPDTFTYTLNAGSSTTVSVDVTCADDAPVAVADSATVSEDSGANPVDVLANDSDVDGGPKSVASVTQPANGSVVITGGGTGTSYTPNADYCNSPPGTDPDTYTYMLNGGSVATVSMTVICVVDSPSVEATGGSLVYVENDPPTAIDPAITVTEPDAGGLVSATVQISSNYAGPEDVLALENAVSHLPITAMLTGDTLTLSGGTTGADYQAALRDVSYANSSESPSTLPRTVTFTVTDDTALSGSDTRGITVVSIDDSPVAVNDSTTVAEDSAAAAVAVLANDTDIDNGPKSISSVTQPANGAVVITGGGTGLTYQPNANYCNTPPGVSLDTFTYTLAPGGSVATVSVAVTCVNDAPFVDTSAGPLAYTENNPATAIDPGVIVTDADAGAAITGATVKITANYGGLQDVLELANAAAHLPITANVVGDTLTLTGTAPPLAYQAALRDVTYANSSESPSTLARTVTFTVTDDTALSGSDTRTITVAAVDDPPVAVNDAATVLEDAAATAVPVLANDTDIDGGPKSIFSVTQPTGGTVVITGGGTGLTYQPNANFCNTPPPADTFTYTLAPGGSTATVSMTVTCVNDAPVADDETFNGADSAIGNTSLVGNDPSDGAPATPDPTDTSPVTDRPHKTITGDILAGDTDIDTSLAALTVQSGTFATNDGGTVTLQADGDFVFEPAAVTSCTDTSDFFDYTLKDNDPTTPLTDTGRVTIAITGCVWYVNNDDAGGNLGTSEKPFDTIAQAETATPGAGTSIFVYDGNATYTTGLDLDANQQLIGEAATLTIGSDTLHTADSANRPTLTENNADLVVLAAGNTVKGLQLDPQGAGGGISGGAGDAGGTIDDVLITDTGTAGTQAGLELNGTTGTYNISNLTINNLAATGQTSGSVGVLLNSNTGPVNFLATGTISITIVGAKGLDAATTNMGSASVFDFIQVTGSGSGGVNMLTTTGTTTFGDGTGTDLDLTTTSGSAPAFALNNAGTIALVAGGTDNVSATGGPAVDVSGTSGATLPFDAVSSTNSANDGINLDSLGTGTFSAASGSIGGAAGIAFDLNSGSGTITYPGDLNNGTGAAAEITNRTGGAVTLSGAINDTNDAGGGITLSGNGGAGTATFSNALKTLNTAGGDAIVMSSSDNFTLNLTGGGLNIDTTSGKGLEATGSGTINVTGSGNTIDTTTGVALNITNTDIAATHVTFEHISSNGATNGIVLNGTGSAGRLVVTGTGSVTQGGDNSGGTIQSTSGAGISLNNTFNPSFNNIRILNTAGSGVDGRLSTNGFTITNSRIDNSGTSLAAQTSNIGFNDQDNANETNLIGAVTITNNVLLNAYYHGVSIVNFGGTISSVNVSNNAITSSTSTATSKGTGIQLNTFQSAAITDATINNNTVSNFPSDAGVMVQCQNEVEANPMAACGSGSGNAIDVTNNTIAGQSAANRIGTQGILINANGRVTATFNASGNSITNTVGNSISNNVFGDAIVTSTINNNTIVKGDAANTLATSGIVGGVGLTSGFATNTPQWSATLLNNNISGTDGNGILLVAREAVVHDDFWEMSLRITNNTVAAPLGGNRPGIRVDAGNDATDDDDVRLAISGNTTLGSGTSPGIGVRRQGTDNVAPLDNQFGIEGLPSSPANETVTQNWITNQNPGSEVGTGFDGNLSGAIVLNGSNFTSAVVP